jgi:hypothetical protein
MVVTCASVSLQKSECAGVVAEDVQGRRPQRLRFLVWAPFRTASAMVIYHSQVFHHRVVPPDELLRELARFEGTDPIAKSSIHVHVRPSSEPAGLRGANNAVTTMTPCSARHRALRRCDARIRVL